MIALLAPDDPHQFPNVRHALRQPNGLLAAGGDLNPQRLISAYQHGIFPWFNVGDPILWWSPDPRTVLFPEHIHIARSLGKRLRRRQFEVTLDRAFTAVIHACAAPRGHADEPASGTWILPEMIAAYEQLHRLGISHSVEVWAGEQLVGGLYGVAIGQAFFGESMFSRTTDASKVALVYLCQALHERGFGLIDCQMRTEHLMRLGAVEMPRAAFVARLRRYCIHPGNPGSWDDGAHHFPLDRPPEGPAATSWGAS